MSAAVLTGAVSIIPVQVQAANYTQAPERIDDNVISSTVNMVVFENFSSEALYGGALYNTKDNKNVNINANFKNNKISSENNNTYGGAIYNSFSQIRDTDIGDEMINMKRSRAVDDAAGLAPSVVSKPALGNINGNFTQNSAHGRSAYGGAIYNTGEIANIKGDYVKNSVSGGNVYGGAIFNGALVSTSVIHQANGSGSDEFVDLKRTVTGVNPSYIGNGSASNQLVAKIESITGNFVENSALGETVYGGAIYNGGHSTSPSAGAMHQAGTSMLGGVGGQNPSSSSSVSTTSYIGAINANFTGNIAQGGYAYGGAIYNGASPTNSSNVIDSRSGMQIPNNITGITGDSNRSTHSYIGSINGDFTGNLAQGGFAAYGGAIYNGAPEVGRLTLLGSEIAKTGAMSLTQSNSNGAAYIDSIKGTFTNNSAQGQSAYGGAIYNGVVEAGRLTLLGTEIADSPAMLVQNKVPTKTGINIISGNFYGNSAEGNTIAQGGAIYNAGLVGTKTYPEANQPIQGALDLLSGDRLILDENTTDQEPVENLGVPVYSGGIINSSFIGNRAIASSGTAQGGAIYTTTDLTFVAKDGYTTVFQGNYTESNGKRDDNAIYVGSASTSSSVGSDIKNPELGEVNQGQQDVLLSRAASATSKKTETLSSGYKVNRAGYDANIPTLTFKMENGGQILLLDNIDGDLRNLGMAEEDTGSSDPGIRDTDMNDEMLLFSTASEKVPSGYRINRAEDDAAGLPINKEDNQNTQQQNYGYNVDIVGDDINNTTFYLLNDIRNASVTFANTTINTVNNNVHVYDFGALTIGADTKMYADVDLKNRAMDRFTAKGSLIGVQNSDMADKMLQQAGISLLATDDAAGLEVSENITNRHQGNLIVSGMNLLSDSDSKVTEVFFAQEGLKNNVATDVSEVYTPIYKYSVRYDNRNDGGYFVFTRGGSGGGNSYKAYNPAVVAAPVSSQAGVQATVNETFKYVFEHADAFTQMPALERSAKINGNQYALSTDYNNNLGSLAPEFNNKAGWFRPYVTFEKMNLKNGPSVDAITYGSLVGFDSDFQKFKHGWTGLTTGYIGYNGSQLNYKGVDTSMNGGLVGLTQTFYKGNLWTALTVSAGASVGETHTMYGKEDFTSLLAGVGSKTGYNFEFKEGKYIIQPIWFMSYTFVNTFDYTNAAGVKIESDPTHSIQLNPSIRFIANTKSAWQPYASVGMVWNVMNDTSATANGVKLPEMSMKPYVEYGLGIQKRFKDKFTAFGQAMLRNGGRNGISITGGFRWSLGKTSPQSEKVQIPHNDRTVLRQLSSQQKMAINGKKHTTITSSNAVLRQL